MQGSENQPVSKKNLDHTRRFVLILNRDAKNKKNIFGHLQTIHFISNKQLICILYCVQHRRYIL
jgi:hypothetical protein